MAPYNPPIAHYAHLNLVQEFGPIYEDEIKAIVGEHGANFKTITKDSGVKYIWLNKDTNCIEIWGSENNVPIAMKKLIHHVTDILIRASGTD